MCADVMIAIENGLCATKKSMTVLAFAVSFVLRRTVHESGGTALPIEPK